MTEQPAIPEPSPRPLPRLGHGVHWPEITDKIRREGGSVTAHPDAETKRLLAERAPQLFRPTVGRGDLRQYPLADDEQPATVPARPYGGEVAELRDALRETIIEAFEVPLEMATLARGHDRPLVSEEQYVPCRFDDETCVGQITADRLCDVHRFGPPPAVELRAMADDLNTHGGLDEAFVAGLLRQAADPYADAKRGLGIVDPPPVTTTKPSPSFTDMIAKACDDALRVPPPAPIVVHPNDYEMFKDLMTPRPTPITYAEIIALFARMSQPLPFDTVKLTQAQIDAFPASRFTAPSVEPQHFFGTPVELVDTVEESTPYQLANVRPAGIISIPTEVTDEQMEQLRADWLRNLDAGPRPMRVVGDGPPFRGYLREIVAAPSEHQHVYGGSPLRCVECRRYLRPWWRRTLDRVRRWGR